jgi:hypothetical protein
MHSVDDCVSALWSFIIVFNCTAFFNLRFSMDVLQHAELM